MAAYVNTVPSSAILRVGPSDAEDIARCVADLPIVDAEEMRDRAVQAKLRRSLASRCDAFAALVMNLGGAVVRPPHFAIIDGLEWDAGNLLLVLLAGSLGDVEPYLTEAMSLVKRLEPATDIRNSAGTLNERLHTDGTNWPVPNDFTCLLCVRTDDEGGGRTRLLGEEDLRTALAKSKSREIEDVLAQDDIPWQLDPGLGGGVAHAPVLGRGRLRWLRHTIDLAVEGGATVPRSVYAAIDVFDSVIEEVPGVHEFLLGEGQFVAVDNRHCLHARTGIPKPETSRRLVLRAKVGRKE